MADAVRLTDDDGLAVLTIDHPPLNLLDDATELELHDAIERLAAAPPRALLLRAEGDVWTAGVDVHLFAALGEPADASAWFARGLATIQKVEDLPCPVVFAAHGLCLTWGFELALACDIVVAAESARFGLVEARVGLTPSWGGPQRLSRRVGPARAKHLIMTATLSDARTLHAWGMVSEVWPDVELESRARALASSLAQGPTLAHATTKQIMSLGERAGVRAADTETPQLSGRLFETTDLRDAVQSFLTDGPSAATFRGR